MTKHNNIISKSDKNENIMDKLNKYTEKIKQNPKNDMYKQKYREYQNKINTYVHKNMNKQNAGAPMPCPKSEIMDRIKEYADQTRDAVEQAKKVKFNEVNIDNEKYNDLMQKLFAQIKLYEYAIIKLYEMYETHIIKVWKKILDCKNKRGTIESKLEIPQDIQEKIDDLEKIKILDVAVGEHLDLEKIKNFIEQQPKRVLFSDLQDLSPDLQSGGANDEDLQQIKKQIDVMMATLKTEEFNIKVQTQDIEQKIKGRINEFFDQIEKLKLLFKSTNGSLKTFLTSLINIYNKCITCKTAQVDIKPCVPETAELEIKPFAFKCDEQSGNLKLSDEDDESFDDKDENSETLTDVQGIIGQIPTTPVSLAPRMQSVPQLPSGQSATNVHQKPVALPTTIVPATSPTTVGTQQLLSASPITSQTITPSAVPTSSAVPTTGTQQSSSTKQTPTSDLLKLFNITSSPLTTNSDALKTAHMSGMVGGGDEIDALRNHLNYAIQMINKFFRDPIVMRIYSIPIEILAKIDQFKKDKKLLLKVIVYGFQIIYPIIDDKVLTFLNEYTTEIIQSTNYFYETLYKNDEIVKVFNNISGSEYDEITNYILSSYNPQLNRFPINKIFYALQQQLKNQDNDETNKKLYDIFDTEFFLQIQNFLFIECEKLRIELNNKFSALNQLSELHTTHNNISSKITTFVKLRGDNNSVNEINQRFRIPINYNNTQSNIIMPIGWEKTSLPMHDLSRDNNGNPSDLFTKLENNVYKPDLSLVITKDNKNNYYYNIGNVFCEINDFSVTVNGIESMFSTFFTKGKLKNPSDINDFKFMTKKIRKLTQLVFQFKNTPVILTKNEIDANKLSIIYQLFTKKTGERNLRVDVSLLRKKVEENKYGWGLFFNTQGLFTANFSDEYYNNNNISELEKFKNFVLEKDKTQQSNLLGHTYVGNVITFTMDYDNYIFGPFTRVFPTNMTNAEIADSNEIKNIINNLKQKKHQIIAGYGSSGSGKTSALIVLNTKIKQGDGTDKLYEQGIIMMMCDKLTDTYDNLTVNFVEMHRNLDKPDNSPEKYITRSHEAYKPKRFKSENKSWVQETQEETKEVKITTSQLPHSSGTNVENITLNFSVSDKQNNKSYPLSQYVVEVMEKVRFTSPTPNNPQSSRSHMLIIFEFTKKDGSNVFLFIIESAGKENKAQCNSPSVINEYLGRYEQVMINEKERIDDLMVKKTIKDKEIKEKKALSDYINNDTNNPDFKKNKKTHYEEKAQLENELEEIEKQINASKVNATATEICNDRTREGEFINGELDYMINGITSLFSSEQVPPFHDSCLQLQCNNSFQNCFKSVETNVQNDNSMIIKQIKEKLGSDNFNATNVNICIFLVANLSKNANNPPPSPYIDITELKLELLRLQEINNKSYPTFDATYETARYVDENILVPINKTRKANEKIYGRYYTGSNIFQNIPKENLMKELSVSVQTDINNLCTEIEKQKNETNLEISISKLKELIKILEISNSITTIGTFETTDLFAKNCSRVIPCRIPHAISVGGFKPSFKKFKLVKKNFYGGDQKITNPTIIDLDKINNKLNVLFTSLNLDLNKLDGIDQKINNLIKNNPSENTINVIDLYNEFKKNINTLNNVDIYDKIFVLLRYKYYPKLIDAHNKQIENIYATYQ